MDGENNIVDRTESRGFPFLYVESPWPSIRLFRMTPTRYIVLRQWNLQLRWSRTPKDR